MAFQVNLIPVQELSTGQAAAIRNEAVTALEAMATKELSLPTSSLLTRDIRPKEDLDYTYSSWSEVTGATADTYETMLTQTLGDDRYLAIYGVMDLSPTITVSKLRIKVGNSIKTEWVLENLYPIYPEGPRIGFCRSVVVVPQNTPLLVERYVRSTTQGAYLVLKGIICERVGKVMSPA